MPKNSLKDFRPIYLQSEMFFLIIFVAALVRIRGRTGIAVTYEYKWHKDIDINHITLRVMYRGHHLYFRFLKTSLSVSHPLTFCVQNLGTLQQLPSIYSSYEPQIVYIDSLNDSLQVAK